MPVPGSSVGCGAIPPPRNREHSAFSWDKAGPGVALLPGQVLLTRRVMTADPAQVRAIFLEAIEKQSCDTWDQFLDAACTGNAELRRQVARLLDAHRRAGDFLAQGAIAPGRAADRPSPPVQEAPGTVIGPYKLLEQIGEGGFGVVSLAQQNQPVRRKVALKVVKPATDTRDAVARIDAERHALAIMDRPN